MARLLNLRTGTLGYKLTGSRGFTAASDGTRTLQQRWTPAGRPGGALSVPMAQERPMHGIPAPAPVDPDKTSEGATAHTADYVASTSYSDLSPVVLRRCKRMILDTLGVMVVGSTTEVAGMVAAYSLAQQGVIPEPAGSCALLGRKDRTTSAPLAAFANGVSAHSMDFDDTWHPATHPSAPVLASLLALTDLLRPVSTVSGRELLQAFAVGIEVQGRLLRTSAQAKNIPWRFHPPAVVGVMGSAAACAKLLQHDPTRVRNAMSAAASYAGAPMANAGTTAKPLHAGNAARFGLEAALLASVGMKGNPHILDMRSGFCAFFDDFVPETLQDFNGGHLLDKQDVAIKRFPAHLGTHWASDAAAEVRGKLARHDGTVDTDNIRQVVVHAPKCGYVNRPIPKCEHEARHSFQFNVCTTLLDGTVRRQSFGPALLHRPELRNLLRRTDIRHPPDNIKCFETMYVDVEVRLRDGTVVTARCTEPYGHWRRPLRQEDVVAKFRDNAEAALPGSVVQECVGKVQKLENLRDCSELTDMLSCP
ncbi:cis-aconitate decarboxylase-like [Branchiostoma floridae]|uniref:Cis-aconitate decarboxylase-like n=1 Tax=Branchiostoma floridae TaxID=7739 RepID=A0A9J7MR76_BRAFL|nr:cis-aconitate decarboxylase-like [Branchiostoma floridae]